MGTSERSAPTLQAFCIGHKPPVFEPPAPFTMVCPAALGLLDEIVIADDLFGQAFHGSILSEYTQLFGLAERLKGLPRRPDALYLFQYRKLVSRQAGSRLSSNMPYAYASNPEDAAHLYRSGPCSESLATRLLTGPALRHQRTIAFEYSSSHLVEDFAAFAAACSMSGALDPPGISRFINCNVLIPSPSLGQIPTPLFLEVMDTLRLVWTVFARHFLKARDGYQRRVGGFLLERLHSFLLVEHVRARGVTTRIAGNLIVVSESHVIGRTE